MRYAIQQFHARVQSLLPADANSVLEVGCGEGFSTSAILEPYAERHLHGGDLSHAAVIEAKHRFDVPHYCVFSAYELPYAADTVDAILSLEVLEHLPQAGRAIAEMKRVSRRYLLLSVPNEPIFRGLRFVSGKGVMQLGDHPEHVNHWSSWGFKRFLAAQGLSIVDAASPPPFSWSIVLCVIDAD